MRGSYYCLWKLNQVMMFIFLYVSQLALIHELLILCLGMKFGYVIKVVSVIVGFTPVVEQGNDFVLHILPS